MKNENYNVIIKTLDDRAMYKEIGRRLSEIDRSRYLSMWLVPLVSGLIILLLWLEFLQIPTLINVAVSVFGALMTYFYYRWAKQNTQLTHVFRKHAALLELRKNQQESLKAEISNEGPYSLIQQLSGISLAGVTTATGKQGKGSETTPPKTLAPEKPTWNKEKVEAAVYKVTIGLWILTIVLGLVKIYNPGSFTLI